MIKVLFIDDEKSARDFIKMSCKAYGVNFEIDTAASSYEAINMINNTAYNAIIIDISLPDLQGTVLAKLVHDAFPKIPMTFLTAYDSSVATNMSVEFPMDYWDKTEKMANFETIKRCIDNLVAGKTCDGLRNLGDHNMVGTGKITLPKRFTDTIDNE